MDDTDNSGITGQETGPTETGSTETGPIETGPAKRKGKPFVPEAPTEPLRGVVASAARKAIFGPDGPVGGQTARQKLCGLLNLKGPTDSQLFADAAAMIENLRAQLK